MGAAGHKSCAVIKHISKWPPSKWGADGGSAVHAQGANLGTSWLFVLAGTCMILLLLLFGWYELQDGTILLHPPVWER